MITVTIYKNGRTNAKCVVSGPPAEAKRDFARLNNLPYSDRQYIYDTNPPHWLVTNADKYAWIVPEIGRAMGLLEQGDRS